MPQRGLDQPQLTQHVHVVRAQRVGLGLARIGDRGQVHHDRRPDTRHHVLDLVGITQVQSLEAGLEISALRRRDYLTTGVTERGHRVRPDETGRSGDKNRA